MNVKVLLIFCDTSVTVQPSLTFADAPSEGPVPTQKRTNGKIIAHFKPLFQQNQHFHRACPLRLWKPHLKEQNRNAEAYISRSSCIAYALAVSASFQR